ncbi:MULTISPECIES: hypothetical protein [Terrisporobacter]|uniref:Phosphagen kinase C-terminal domain-containing protein n=2 Tax=Terrisporobacter TaxID=1505652 RepID=A0A0B3VIC8_9FIRM|nr:MULTISPECIES: hypothetical protein [Terrisporobacter]KHS56601.1 hypothetical protein QX51_13100 [Terrisporobacter othiniensis]MCC3671460.1 hypothetical protein [Terrisporobacter mayombei]MCR1822235.1 hypothetical protein [Terrisporobacter muris]MDU6986378.1 hypothetical protein [Terrisporobacter othiniensis]MDY3372097.1 hypothetical protein [Terrisporobacter othiniensis]
MEDSIIIGTKVSLSRNINNYPFPHKLSQSESQVIANKINNIILESEDLFQEDFIAYNIKDISQIEKNTLIERNIISNKFSTNDIGSIIINKDKTKYITVNDQEHIKINIYENKFNVDEAFIIANKIDDILESKLDYAFDDKLGYLTSCPVNAGTGLKASIIVHLPILSLQRRVDTYSNIAHKLGANIKGICNEKSNILGNMYEISNQSVIGRSEKNIIESLKSLTKDIITKERESRTLVKMEASIELEDEVYRALGILQNARIITAYEAMKHLSNIKLGIEMDYIKDINIDKIINLMKGMKPALRLMSPMTGDSDTKRADFLREEFTLANRNKK